MQSAKALKEESLIPELLLDERCNKLVALSLHPTTNCTSTPHAPSSLLSETPLKVLIGAGSKCQLPEEYAHANIHQSSFKSRGIITSGLLRKTVGVSNFSFPLRGPGYLG